MPSLPDGNPSLTPVAICPLYYKAKTWLKQTICDTRTTGIIG
jgi:hypothetical protein